MADYSQFKTSTDPEFLATQSRPMERTREANARALATAANKVQPINLYQSGTVAIDPGSISANTRASISVALDNVAPGDFLIWNPPANLNNGLVYAGSIVSTSGTATVFIGNITGSGIDDTSKVWEYLALRLS